MNPNEVVTAADLAKRIGGNAAIALKEAKALQSLGIIRRSRPVLVQTAAKTKKPTSKKVETWTYNQDFKHARVIASFVHEISPVKYDSIVGMLKRSCKVSAVILSGSFMGDPTRPADIIVAADPLNERKLESAIRALEPAVGREIRYAAFSTPEFRYRLTIQDRLIRDTLDFPHLVLFDRTRLL